MIAAALAFLGGWKIKLLAAALAFLGGWKIKLLAAGLAVAIVGGYILYLRADVADARADAAQYQANAERLKGVVERTNEAYRRLQEDAAKAEAALASTLARADANAAERSALITESTHAPGDRPVGPVLDLYYQRLWALDGPRTGGGGDSAGGGPPP